MRKTSQSLVLVAIALFAAWRPASAITLGQIDNFQDGTTMGWDTGGFATPLQNLGGGPGGAADRFIRITADGSGGGGRIVAFDVTHWTGNYIAAGVKAISIDLRNDSAVALSIRFAFQSEIVQGGPGYLSTAMLLPANSGWQHFSISIAPGTMTAVNGPTAYNTFFQNVAWFRIIHEVGTANMNGDPVVGLLGFDNVQAVPEPTATALAAGGVLLWAGLCLWRRRQAVQA